MQPLLQPKAMVKLLAVVEVAVAVEVDMVRQKEVQNQPYVLKVAVEEVELVCQLEKVEKKVMEVV